MPFTPDIVGFFNHPVPGNPDPQATRIVILLFVMLVAFEWSRTMRRKWHEWSRKTKRVTQWVTIVLMSNGMLLITAAQRDDPIRVGTAVLGLAFLGFALSLYARFPGDDSSDPVYAQFYPDHVWQRIRHGG